VVTKHIEKILVLLTLGIFSVGAHAQSFSTHSHKTYQFANGVILLKANKNLKRSSYEQKKCSRFPTPLYCSAGDIKDARMQYRSGKLNVDYFVNPLTWTILAADCDVDQASCLDKYRAQLGLTGSKMPAPFKQVIGDVDADKNSDMVLISRSKQLPFAILILSTPGQYGERSAPIVRQVLDQNALGVAPYRIKHAKIRDVNQDQRGDLIYYDYKHSTKRIALSSYSQLFGTPSIDNNVLRDLPSERVECGYVITHPQNSNQQILFDETCSTAFIAPPEIGNSQVTKLEKNLNLDFCPVLNSAGTEADYLTNALVSITQRLIDLADELTSDATTAYLESQIVEANLIVEQTLTAYQFALQQLEEKDIEITFAEDDLNICFGMGGLCDLEFDHLLDLEMQRFVLEDVVDTTLSNYMKARDAEQALTLQVAEYRRNQLSSDPVYLGLWAEFNALQQMGLSLYQELSVLEGAMVRFDYKLNMQAHLDEYRKLNSDSQLSWRYLPINKVDLLTNLESVGATTGSPVLWMNTQDKTFDYTLFPSGNTTVTKLVSNKIDPITITDTSHVDIGLGLLGACQYFSQGVNTAVDVTSLSNLTAFTPVNLQYTYYVEAKTGYTVSYNLYQLVQSVFTRAIYYKLLDELIKRKTLGSSNNQLSINNISNEELASLIDSNVDAHWFYVEFDADSDYQYDLLEQEEIRLAVKSELIRKAFRELALVYRATPIVAKSDLAFNPSAAPAASDDCWQRYGSLCRFNQYLFSISDTLVTNFRLQNDKWVTEKIQDTGLSERNSGTTFSKDASLQVGYQTTVEEPVIGPSLPDEIQVYVHDGEGQLNAVYDQTALTTYIFDDNGRIVKERRHTDTPVKPLWTTDFSLAGSGLTNLPTAFMQVVAGQLKVTTQSNATPTWKGVWGTRAYQLDEQVTFRAEVKTGEKVDGRYLVVGIDGDWSKPTYRRHAAYFDGDALFVSYYDGTYQTKWLGTIENNAAYIVEVESHASGTRLFVYPKGLDRSAGFSDVRNYSDWGSLRTFIEAKAGPGEAPASMYISAMSESVINGRIIGQLIAVENDKDRVREFIYNDLNQVEAIIDTAGSLIRYQYDTNNNAISQTFHRNKPIPVLWAQHFDANANGFWQVPEQHMKILNGKLEVKSIVTPDWQWVAATSKRQYSPNQNIVFRAEVETGALSESRYLLIGIESDTDQAGPYRRHAAYFDGDSIFAAYYDNDYQSRWLSVVGNQTVFVIEIETSINSSTLYVYPKGSSRSNGLIDQRNYNDWNVMQSFIEARSYPNATGASMLIHSMSEAYDEGEVLGNYVVQTNIADISIPVQ